MNIALELVHLQGRSCARVYHALAWICIKARRNPAKRLRPYARLLGLSATQARELEDEARGDKTVRIGRDPAERIWLRQAISELAQAHPALAAVGEIIARRVVNAPRPCPFEESQIGPPIVLPFVA